MIHGHAALIATLLLAACGHAATTSSATTIDTLPGGAVRVRNTAPADWSGTTGWKLVLERTIGDGDGTTFTAPGSLAVSAGHEIFVLDRKPAQIKVFDAEGKFERTIGRMGGGPGEYAEYGDLLIVRDTLVVIDPGNSRFVTFTVAGDPVGEHRDGGRSAHWPATNDGRFAVAADLVQRPPTQTDYYPGSAAVFFKLDGARTGSITLPPEPEPGGWALNDVSHEINPFPFAPSRVVTFNHRGELIWGDQATYRLIVSKHGSDTLRIIEAHGDALPIPDSVRNAELASTIEDSPMMAGIAKLADIPHVYPLWTDVTTDGDDNIWVLRPGANTTGDSWDVFAPDGHLRGTVAAPLHGSYGSFWTSTHVYMIDRHADAAPVIQIYRIDRRGH